MLHSLKISGLYGLYSYNLSFISSPDDTIRFITGPNGYGKTTILNIIFALYQYDFYYLMKIPYDKILFDFGNELIEIKQERIVKFEEDSDIESNENIRLIVDYHKKLGDTSSLIDHLIIDSSNFDWLYHQSSLRLYLESLYIYYIKDFRLYHKKEISDGETDNPFLRKEINVEAVNDNAEHLKNLLSQFKNNFNLDNLPLTSSVNSTQKADLNDIKILQQTLNFLYEWGIINEISIYTDDSIEKIDEIKRRLKPFSSLIEALKIFYSIITKSEFSHKKLELSHRFGYRFVSDNEVKTILANDQLSSGEQHILIQTYELLFLAKKYSLILIDEPEISFHLAWQIQFLKNLKAIASQRQLQCIVGTHSPQVFDSKWSLSIDLYDQSNS